MQPPVQMIHFILCLSSSHRSEERQRRSTSRAFQRQGGRHLHRVRRGLHGGGAGEAQPTEGDAAFTQGTCTLTTCRLPTLEAVPRPRSRRVRCQMKFIELSARAINGRCLLCQEQLCLMQRATVIIQNFHASQNAPYRSGWAAECLCACSGSGRPRGTGSLPDAVFIKGASGLARVQPSSA